MMDDTVAPESLRLTSAPSATAPVPCAPTQEELAAWTAARAPKGGRGWNKGGPGLPKHLLLRMGGSPRAPSGPMPSHKLDGSLPHMGRYERVYSDPCGLSEPVRRD